MFHGLGQQPVPQGYGMSNLRFPGSQPVSLDRKNLQLLRQKYYYATWKADGTRYMMLIARGLQCETEGFLDAVCYREDLA